MSSDGLCDGCRQHYNSLRRTYDNILEETTEDKEEDKLCVDVMSLVCVFFIFK